jgi:hypothetical protein
MVDEKIYNASYPVTVKMGKEMKNGTLVLNVIHGKEMEIEYKKNEIIDKINSFFGYNCINQVTLKIVHNIVKSNVKVVTSIKNLSLIEGKLKKVNDERLKNYLNNFLKAYNDKNK